MAGLGGIGHDAVAELFIDVCGENRAFERAGNDRRRKEEALIQRGHQAEVRADLLTQTRRGEAIGAAIDAGLRAADIAADGGQTAARILNQRTDDHIRADVARLDGFHKLAVAVIDHADDIGTDGLDERDQLADLPDGERRAGGVALAALDGDELGARVDCRADAVVINRAVRLERNLRIAHAVFLERAGAFADADDLFQRVIRAADGGKQPVARQQVGAQRDGERVGATGDLRADERGLRVEAVGINALKRVAADVVVAVARRAREAGDVHAVLLHGRDDLGLIVFRRAVDFIKARAKGSKHLFAEAINRVGDAVLSENILTHGFALSSLPI